VERTIARTARITAVIALVASLSQGGCTHPSLQLAAGYGFERSVVPGNGYLHVAFRAERQSTPRLHVYLDGDGRPWVNGRAPSRDPTPANPLALRLMAADVSDAVYVGRPCYFEMHREPACGPQLWTFARYSEEVISSMVLAVNRLSSAGGHLEVVLIGYSGGGALARLIAPEINNLVGILTVSANLDTEVWSAGHGYLPLVSSMNPADASPLPENILHVAVVGERDRVVPSTVVDAYIAAGHRAEVWRYADADHACCW
jgi:hypothetical protein